jgi:DNA repair protein RecN (Recombination protein N)
MLRRLVLRDFVIVAELELDFGDGFSVLTGETGAGKSILIDALQLALGGRADSAQVREGTPRTEVVAEFDSAPGLTTWADEAGFDLADGLLLRRTVDAQGKSRAWINGTPATVTQLREAAEHLVDIHGQHAWQSLTRPASVRELLDAQAGVSTVALTAAFARRQHSAQALSHARGQGEQIERERERLAWQIAEIDKLGPGDAEWDELNIEHQRLAHSRDLLDAASAALDAASEGETSATEQVGRALTALAQVAEFDPRLAPVVEVLQGAQAQLHDATHTLSAYLGHTEVDPGRLAEVDARLAAWLGLARRYRRSPADLPALVAQWRGELRELEATLDIASLEAEAAAAELAFGDEARRVGQARRGAAGPLAERVSEAMQTLGMVGGKFEIAFSPLDKPQASGLDAIEFRVAGHAGTSPRSLAKVASGGELSRLALAIAVVCSGKGEGAPTLIFDEIDVGIGGSVGDAVGALMKQLGRDAQVFAVTHLAQVAACADRHFVVAKAQQDGVPISQVHAVVGEERVAEVARMLGGERLAGTSLAHAQALLMSAPRPAEPAVSRGELSRPAEPDRLKNVAAPARTRSRSS